jgi:hypothetical protein
MFDNSVPIMKRQLEATMLRLGKAETYETHARCCSRRISTKSSVLFFDVSSALASSVSYILTYLDTY